MSANIVQVEIEVPRGMPLNPKKKQKEEKQIVKDHIDSVNHIFDKLSLSSGGVQTNHSKRLNLQEYKVDAQLFGFSVTNYDLRKYANFLTQKFYEICISEPISNLDDQILTQQGIDKTPLMKNIKQQTLSYGKRETIYQLLYICFFIGIIISDILQLIYNNIPDINGEQASYFLYLRIFTLSFLDIAQFIYVYNANRISFYAAYLLILIVTIISILCLTGYNLFGETLLMLSLHLVEAVIILLVCLSLCLHLYRLEINLQRIRVLLGARYQSPIICCQ